MTVPTIRVAVVGGGLGGTVLTNALIKYPHLDVQLYESSPEFKERGASVSLAINARRALSLLGMGDIVKKAKGVEVASYRMVVGEGPEAQVNIIDMPAQLESVHRAALLHELLAPIPKDRLNLGKRLASISDGTIKFQDGTSATADLIIGADGIHSSVRRYVLGENHPALNPVFAGFWDCRNIVPVELAQAKLGTYRIDSEAPLQHMYLGNKCMLFHDTIDDGKNICVVAGGMTPPDWDQSQWKRTVSREWLNETFSTWDDFASNFLDLVCGDKQETSTFVQWESGEAPALHNGKNLCLIGDAAHATTPWQGSGLAMVIEDSLVLQSVLGKCRSVDDIPAALEAYDHQMRPRGLQIIKSSRGTGLINCGKNGLGAKQLHDDLKPRWDFIYNWDAEGAVRDAIAEFESLTKQK